MQVNTADPRKKHRGGGKDGQVGQCFDGECSPASRFLQEQEKQKGGISENDCRIPLQDRGQKKETGRSAVKWDIPNYRKRIGTEASNLATLKFSGLPRNIDLVTAFLCGSASLNGRDRVCEADFATLALLKQYFGWYR